jgi:hypothetical protein
MIENGYETMAIAAALGMSRETIRNHKKIWEYGGRTYKKVIGRLAKREKTKDFWNKVEEVLYPLDLFLQSKSNIKARAKLLSGDTVRQPRS